MEPGSRPNVWCGEMNELAQFTSLIRSGKIQAILGVCCLASLQHETNVLLDAGGSSDVP